MRWSYGALQATPEHVVDEVARWMRDLDAAERKREQDARREAERMKRKR